MTTFVDDVVAGRTTLDALDDYIDRWHDGEGRGSALHDFLGLTWEEYGAWIKDPAALNTVIALKRSAPAEMA